MRPGSSDGHAYDCPLPTGSQDDVWKKSPLGPPTKWPKCLQAHVHTAASFSYPAAIFWGEQLALLCNSAWFRAVDKAQQGQAQRGLLKADAWSAIDAALHGGEPRRIASKYLLQDGEDRTVLLSPLFGEGKDSDNAVGVLAQLLATEQQQRDSNGEGEVDQHTADKSGAQAPGSHLLDLSKLGKAEDKVPLDQHPFFHRFAEMLPSGLAILDPEANAIFVNQQFYELTTHQGDDQTFKAWPQSIHPDDYDRVMGAYQDAFNSQKQLRTEFRALGQEHPWRLLLLTPLGDENLEHVSLREYGGFICSVVDITSEKSAEITERNAAKEATQRKEQQERFIDMISHEIRNPLSAIVHCTENIEEALEDDTGPTNVDQIKEALETINLCLQHQRNIVDDVLSFSKLDASMLTLSPKASQPSRHLASTTKIFRPEFRKQGMQFRYSIDESYNHCNIGQVMADEPRVGQVLVNLLSNAVKFTARKTERKEIEVRIAASMERPDSYPPDMVFFASEDSARRQDMTEKSEWGEGEVLYVMVAVKDTGIGISEEGQKRLFERFQQATPKTEQNYGGSGLGLNISRKICHLHGGEIGVSSVEGEGSTFGFFFRVKRCVLANMAPSAQGSDDEGAIGTRASDENKARGSLQPDDLSPSMAAHSLNKLSMEDGIEMPKLQRSAVNEYAMRSNASGSYHGTGSNVLEDASDRSRQTHVLLVEDNVINQRLLRRKFEAKSFRVTTANNGQEAVDAVKSNNQEKDALDIILMDENMPVLDGSSATKEIRQMEQNGDLRRVPIVGITANVRVEQTELMLQSGMDDVISKPYKTDDMVKRIERLVQR